MKMHNSDTESNIPGIEVISGVVTDRSEKTQRFTVLCPDGSRRSIFVPKMDRTLHLMRNIQLGVQVVIHQTLSGPKTIATYPARGE